MLFQIPMMIRTIVFCFFLTLVLSQTRPVQKMFSAPVRAVRFKQVPSYRTLQLTRVPAMTSLSRGATNDFRFDKVGECPRHVAKRECVNHLFFTFCSSDYDCSGHQKCCLYGCGRERRCLEAVNIPNGCTYRGEKYPELSSFPAPDGCNTCRCEHGKVTCSKTKCAVCYYDGIPYTSQYMFSANDGCNLCRCLLNGRVQCTQKKCQKEDDIQDQMTDRQRRCSQRQEAGLCRQTLVRFWYNPEQQKCEAFYYSGCGGNDNNFQTLRECMMECQA